MLKGRSRQYLATLCVSLAAVTAGVTMTWPTPVIPKFNETERGFNITEEDISWIVALASPGYMAGSLISRYVSDRCGRKTTVWGSAIPNIIGAVIILNTRNVWLISLSRFLWGISSGMIRTVAGMYIAEISDKNIRGTLLSIDRFMLNFGMFLCIAAGPFVSYDCINYVLLILSIGYLIVCFFMPETPYFLLKQGKVNVARKVLKTFNGNHGEQVLEDKLSAMRSDVRKETLRSGSLKEMFTGRQYRKAVFIVLGLKLTQIMTGALTIVQYSSSIMKDSKANISLSAALITFGAVRFIFGLTTVVIVDKFGRRPLLFYSYLISAIVLALMGLYFLILPTSSVVYSFIPFVGIIILSALSTAGYSAVGYIVIAEVFPINIKAVGMSFGHIYTGFFSFISSKGYQQIKDLTGLTGVLWFNAVFGAVGAVFTYFVVLETKGKSLREIQIELQGDIYNDDDEKMDKELVVLQNGTNKSDNVNNSDKS